ncbi:MAG: head GIN domain-containing protein [Chitinophagaceae bacterium]
MKISFALVLLIPVLASCRFSINKKIEGNGTNGREERTISNIRGIELSGPFNVYVTQGNDTRVRIEGDENLLEYVETDRKGDILELGFRDGFRLKQRSKIKVFVSAPHLQQFTVSGSGSIFSASITAADKVNLSVSGSGRMAFTNIDAPTVDSDVSGSGSLACGGTTRTFRAEIAGSGNIDALGLLSEATAVDIAGSGNAEVFASKVLTVNIAGSGDVAYKGTPQVRQTLAGSGKVRKKD